MGLLKSDLVIPRKVKDEHNYLKIDDLNFQGGNTWEYLGIPI